MKIYLRFTASFLLIKMGIETELWFFTVFGAAIFLSVFTEFTTRLARAVEAMREHGKV